MSLFILVLLGVVQGFVLYMLRVLTHRLDRAQAQTAALAKAYSAMAQAHVTALQTQLDHISREVSWRGRIVEVPSVSSPPPVVADPQPPQNPPTLVEEDKQAPPPDPLPGPRRACTIVLWDQDERQVHKQFVMDRTRRGRALVDGAVRYVCCRQEGDIYHYRQEVR